MRVGIAVMGVSAVLGLSGSSRALRAPRFSAGGLVAQFESGRTRLEGGGHELGLSLARFGREGSLVEVPTASPEYERGTVHLRRASLDEWYRSDAQGIEQGFTLDAKPAGEGEVVLEIRVASDAGAKPEARGDGLRIDVGGQDVGIHGLTVVDADGRALVARMEPSDHGFSISFDDHGAKYPVVVDPFYLVETPLLLSGAGTLDSGCTYGPLASNQGGIYMFLGVVCGGSHGAVYVLNRSGSSFTEVARVEPPAPDNVPGSAFGSTIDGGDGDGGVIVGAPGINAAFILNPLTVVKKLTPTGGEGGFGYGVSYHNAAGAYSDAVVYSSAPTPKLWTYHYAGTSWNPAGTFGVGKSGLAVSSSFRVRNGRILGLSGGTGLGAKIDTYKWDGASSFLLDSTLGATSSTFNPVLAFDKTTLVGPQVWTFGGSAWTLATTLPTTATPTAWGFVGSTATALSGTTLDVFQGSGATWSKASYAVASGTTAVFPSSTTLLAEVVANAPRVAVITPTKADGAACAATKECTSGSCVDGVCCDVPCTGACVACTAAKKGSGSDGTCGPAPAASVGRGGCPKGPDAICGPDGLCDGAGACRGPTSKGVSCGASSCAAGTVTGKTCDGAGACGSAPADCAPYVCKDATGCFGACTDDAACLAPNVCVMGACGPKLANGKPSADGKSCASGFSADGVCCDVGCTGSCSACVASKTSGKDGTCAPVASGTDPDGECKATCKGASLITAAACDGAGGCTSGPKLSCAPYGCEAGACKTKCFDDSDCSGASCESGACKVKTGSGPVTGGFIACSAASACPSGFCVEGVCCDSACDAPCHSCALATAPGRCSLAPSGTDPRAQCSGDQSCHQTCNGSGACVAVRAGDQCAPARCTDASHGVGAAICPALDAACPSAAAVAFDCGPFACSEALGACFTQCVASNDCASGFVCDVASARCVAAPAEADSGGCSLGSRQRLPTFFALGVGLFALGLVRRRW